MNTILFLDDDLLPQVLGESLGSDKTPVTFVTPKRNLARSLKRRGLQSISGKLGTNRLYRRAGLHDHSRIIVDLADRGAIRCVLSRIHELVGNIPIVVVAKEDSGVDMLALREEFPGIKTVRVRELVEDRLLLELDYAGIRRLVQQYRQDFEKAERVLILLHDDPDPDSLASALALRIVLGRKKQTAVIGAFAPVTRPENVRMTELLGITVKTLTDKDVSKFDRVVVLDIQPHYWGDRFPEVDLVIDHHPPQKGYNARFIDLRPNVGATSTLLLEHLLASEKSVSERLATAMLYAIKTDTLFLERGVHPADLRAFFYLYSRANLNILRKIEGGGITMERLAFIDRVRKEHFFEDGFLYAHLGEIPRDDMAPALADFFLQLDDVRWCAISGQDGDQVTLSLRNLGYQKSAGDVVKTAFGAIGNAGGHRSAAKAVIPVDAFRKEFGPPDRNGKAARAVYARLREALG